MYDFGAGEATPMVRLHERIGVRIAGSDLSPTMVALGRENLQRHDLDPSLLSRIDIQDTEAVAKESAARGEFDSGISLGVIPHVTDDHGFVRALAAFCRPGGTLLLQFRNAMFSMYTFNRLDRQFILDDLMAPVPEQFRDATAAELDPRECRHAQIDLEQDGSWRGMFMCSAGFIEAAKE